MRPRIPKRESRGIINLGKISMKMKWSLLLACAILLSACNSAAGTDRLMRSALSNIENVSSLSYDLEVNLWQTIYLVQVTGTGQYKNPDRSYLKLSSLGTSFEILSPSTDKIYIKDPVSGSWLPFSAANLAQSGFSPDYLRQQVTLLKAYSQPKSLGSEEIDGIKCAHIHFEIDPARLSEGLLRSMLAGVTDLTGIKITGEIWIGKKDLLPRKSVVVIDTDQNYKLTTTIAYHGFNEETPFPKP